MAGIAEFARGTAPATGNWHCCRQPPVANGLAASPRVLQTPTERREIALLWIGQFLGLQGSRSLVAADLSRQLPNLEPVHFELERAEGDAERPGGGRDVPARLLERPDDEVALEGRDGALQEVLRGRALGVELRYMQLVGQILVRN